MFWKNSREQYIYIWYIISSDLHNVVIRWMCSFPLNQGVEEVGFFGFHSFRADIFSRQRIFDGKLRRCLRGSGEPTISGVDVFGSWGRRGFGWVWNRKPLSWVGWVKLGFLIQELWESIYLTSTCWSMICPKKASCLPFSSSRALPANVEDKCDWNRMITGAQSCLANKGKRYLLWQVIPVTWGTN